MPTCKTPPKRPETNREGPLKLKAGPQTVKVNTKCEEETVKLTQQWSKEGGCYKNGKYYSNCSTTWQESADTYKRTYSFEDGDIDKALKPLRDALDSARGKLKDKGKCNYTSSSTFRYSTRVWIPDNRSGRSGQGTWGTRWRDGSINLNCCDSDYKKYEWGSITPKLNPKSPNPAEEWVPHEPGTTEHLGNVQYANNSCGCTPDTSGGSTNGATEGPPRNKTQCAGPQKQQDVEVTLEQEYHIISCCK